MEDKIIDIIYQYSNLRFDDILSGDKDYKNAHNQLNEKLKKVNKLKLSEKKSKTIDELLTAYNEESSCACRLIYRQGFIDCVSLLKETGVI